MRFFEKISYSQFKLDVCDDANLYNSIKIPQRATQFSAGYDICALYDIIINPLEVIKIPTGIKVCLNDEEFLGIYIRSSLGIKKNVRMCNQVGIIDKDYYNNSSNEGHIFVVLQNQGKEKVTINKGEHFVQAIFQKYLLSDNDVTTGKIRNGGIGSTNKESDDDEGKILY